MAAPEISVVVPSRDRPLRLRWLLNALAGQTLARERWEVVVIHDSKDPEPETLLASHPLAGVGVLRHVQLPAGSALPGAKRNAGWRMARAPVIAFTDDDCRPPPDWLERALAAALRHPGAIVQGRTLPDPLEESIRQAPWFHTQAIRPPTAFAESCNIVFHRAALERVGGFPDEMYPGEDTAVALRVRQSGADHVAAPEMLTYHAVQEVTFRAQLRATRRWRELPMLIKRHPELRDEYVLWVFWKRRHAWMPLFLAGCWLGERRSPAWRALCVPWLMHGPPGHGTDARGRLRSLTETPGALAHDVAEFAMLASGSVKHRTLFV